MEQGAVKRPKGGQPRIRPKRCRKIRVYLRRRVLNVKGVDVSRQSSSRVKSMVSNLTLDLSCRHKMALEYGWRYNLSLRSPPVVEIAKVIERAMEKFVEQRLVVDSCQRLFQE